MAHLLVTHRSYQRRGLASLLLKEMLDQADAEGRKTYIEATDAGYPCYTKLGWKDLDVIEVDLGKYGGEGVKRNRTLLREPVAAAVVMKGEKKGKESGKGGVDVLDLEKVERVGGVEEVAQV